MELFEYLKEQYFQNVNNGIIVEVGAAKPDFLSQSKSFKDIGWRTICIEPNPSFAQLHREIGNEIYEYACSYEDKDDVDFYVVDFGNDISFESFSSLGLEKLSSTSEFDKKPEPSIIKVNVRKLDSILKTAQVSKIDCLIVDVEGWELEVMRGFSINEYEPKVVVLECLCNLEEYHQYMQNLSYSFDRFDDTTGPNYIYFKP